MGFFQITGTAFNAVSSEVVNRSHNNLENETINLKATVDVVKSDFSYQTNKTNNLVVFNDSMDNRLVAVALEDSIMKKLESHFGEGDFFKRDDGITRLTNEAEAFVSGWFGDIAYKREFLSADKNQDGNLDSDEYLNTKNDFNGHAIEQFSNGHVISSHEYIEEIYKNVSNSKVKGTVTYAANKDKVPTSLDDELNDTINNDKNFDSKMTLRESYGQSPFMTNKRMIESHIEDYRKTHKNYGYYNPFNILERLDIPEDKDSKEEKENILNKLQKIESHLLSDILDEKILNELNIKMQDLQEDNQKIEILNKVEENNGDISLLRSDEKEIISKEIEKSTKEDGQIDTDKLEKIINYTKTSQIYKKEEPEQMGKYYEEKG